MYVACITEYNTHIEPVGDILLLTRWLPKRVYELAMFLVCNIEIITFHPANTELGNNSTSGHKSDNTIV